MDAVATQAWGNDRKIGDGGSNKRHTGGATTVTPNDGVEKPAPPLDPDPSGGALEQ